MNLLSAFLMIAALAVLAGAPARADVGPGLYVRDDGRDRGDCTDVAAPCRTIAYALGVAGKNTRIHVAVGRYEFSDADSIIYAMSGAVHVHGGYVENDEGQWIKGGTAFLTSVPPGYRSFFTRHGFVVIADSKGDEDYPRSAAVKLEQFQSALSSAPSADCVGGSASGFECDGVDLLSQTARQDFSSAPGSVADIWGFMDLNTRREYVIVGVRNGSSVFDVTDPSSPREIGFVGGQSATWRDVKVFQYYEPAEDRFRSLAYVTTDGAADGLVVIDLSGLPHQVARVGYTSDFGNAHNVYLTNTDYKTGLALDSEAPQLIVAGAGINNGQFRSYSLENPAAPVFVQRVGNAGYMHDASSMRVDDSRTSQCREPGACTVLFDFNEENVLLWDVTDASSPTLLANVPQYANRGYVHSGWWSEDRRYLFVHDELDESRSSLPTTLRVLSLVDLAAPTLAGQWTGGEASTDHNGFVRGNRYYMSTYTSGLKVLDITNPASPVERGSFDTYPTTDNASFAGAWGAYPFLSDGTVAISDTSSGLYLLRDGTLDVPAGRLGWATASYAGVEGETTVLQIERTGGSNGAVSIAVELIGVTANSADFSYSGGRIAWTDGDVQPKSLAIDWLPDAETEGLEEVILRLVDPQGGATLDSTDRASVFVAEPAATAELALRDTAPRVVESGPGLAVVTVHRGGSAEAAVSVDYVVTADSATRGADFDGPQSGTLTWAAGDALPQSIEFSIFDNAEAEPIETFSLTLQNAQGASLPGPGVATISIVDGSSANTPPVASAGADQVRASNSNVMLNGSASFDPDGDALTFQWVQVSGPAVNLGGATTETATFVAPTVTADASLTFELEVTDERGSSAVADTSVTVTPRREGEGGSGAAGPWLLFALITFLSLQDRRRIRPWPTSHGSRQALRRQ